MSYGIIALQPLTDGSVKCEFACQSGTRVQAFSYWDWTATISAALVGSDEGNEALWAVQDVNPVTMHRALVIAHRAYDHQGLLPWVGSLPWGSVISKIRRSGRNWSALVVVEEQTIDAQLDEELRICRTSMDSSMDSESYDLLVGTVKHAFISALLADDSFSARDDGLLRIIGEAGASPVRIEAVAVPG